MRDLDCPVGERGHVGRRQRLLDGPVDLIEDRGAHVALQRRDVRPVGRVQDPSRRRGDALKQPRVDPVGALHRGLVRIDLDVDRGQVAHGRLFWKTMLQSFFMLTTVQPSSFALASDFSAALV